MINFIKNLLSTNGLSSTRFALLTGLALTIFLVIIYVIICFKYIVWGLSIDLLDKITYLIGVLLGVLAVQTGVNKFAEVKQKNNGDNNGK